MAQEFIPYSRIYEISYYTLGSEEILKNSNVNVVNKETTKNDLPIDGGVSDSHLGTTEMGWSCTTCGNTKYLCPGHFGSIDLKYPLKNPLFREQILKWLKIVCFKCGNLLTDKHIHYISRPNLLIEYGKICRGLNACAYCGEPKKIINKDKLEPTIINIEYSDKHGNQMKTQLYNHEILEIFERITDETVMRVGKMLSSHPKKFILTAIGVSPNTIRPDIRRSGGTKSSSNDITTLTQNIVSINNSLQNTIAPIDKLQKSEKDAFNVMDNKYNEMIKGSAVIPGKKGNNNKQLTSIQSLFPKKEGLIRGHILGKRTTKMARSVITGDQCIRVDEVGLPIAVAKTISIPEVVRRYNKEIMAMYFRNGTKTYPGCSKIIKASNGVQYNIEHLDPNYKLQIGDIVLRNIIDGDVLCINRQPSLEWCSISCMKAVILADDSLTFRLNVSACNLFNADFDGDEMNAIFAQNIQARNEIRLLSTPAEFFISYANKSPQMGAYMDTLLGIAELSFDGVKFNKWNAMNMFSQIDTFHKPPCFNGDTFTNREIISLILPNITMINRTPSFYKSQYQHIVKFNPNDIKVNIKNGVLESGILDKNIAGQGTNGSIFHYICNEYGAQTALDTIHNFTQLANQFLYYRGFTIGFADVSISDSAIVKVKERIEGMLAECQIVTDKLFKRNLIAPIGTTLWDYYEQLQLNILSPGDEFIFPVLEDIDYYKNNFSKMVFLGSKGKLSNFISINAAIGSQTIAGHRPIRTYGYGRTSPYFSRYDLNPRANGYISMSIKEGIAPNVMPFVAGSTRQELINNALSTSITGMINRDCCTNFEGMITDNLRKSVNGQNMIQPLYAESGIDPRKLEKVKFPTIMISDVDMMKKFKCSSSDFDQRFRNSNVEKALDLEFKQLLDDRELYREFCFKIEGDNPTTNLVSDTHYMPVNVARIIDDIIYKYTEESKEVLDPIKTIEKVRRLCETIDYTYFNDFQELVKMPIPEFIREASTLMKIQIRCFLSNAYLIKHEINDAILEVIISKIRLTFKHSLIDYGKCVGIIAAQSICSPMTQSMLDSKHRAAGGGGSAKTNAIMRFREIFGCTRTEKMNNPSMLIILQNDEKEDYANLLANKIEMVRFEKFIYSIHVFFETYGKPIHPKFIDEKKMIDEFEKYNVGIKVPSDLTNWCIRYELDKEAMIIGNISLFSIISAIRKRYVNLYVIHTPETAKKIILRCYLRNGMMKPNVEQEVYVIEIAKKIGKVIIKGVSGIHSAQPIQIAKSYVDEDGAIKSKKVWAVDTYGTNLEGVLRNEGVDPYHTQTDSIMEFYEMYGIEATRNKIIYEIMKASSSFSIAPDHASVFADEMTFLSVPTGIQRTGMQAREMYNISLRMAFQSPVQVIENAALNSFIDRISGLSGPLLTGDKPAIGTGFNQVLINERFIAEQNTINDDDL